MYIRAQCREGGDHRSDGRFREGVGHIEGDPDGGDSGGEEQGDEWDEIQGGEAHVNLFQIRKERFVDGTELQNGEQL